MAAEPLLTKQLSTVPDNPQNLSELKQEKENLREYYNALKNRRDEILALKKIKNSKVREEKIRNERQNQESSPLLFQDGEFKHKKFLNSLEFLPHNSLDDLHDRKMLNEALENRQIHRTPVPERIGIDYVVEPKPEPKPVNPAPKLIINDEPAPVRRSSRDNLTRSIPDIVEPNLNLGETRRLNDREIVRSPTDMVEEAPPIDAPALNLTRPLDQPPLPQQSQPGAPIIIQLQQPPVQQSKPLQTQVYDNRTVAIHPESAIVLEPFDQLKSESEINEEANALMPKSSRLFVFTIVFLTILLAILIIFVFLWGFASSWELDVNSFVENFKNFFAIN